VNAVRRAGPDDAEELTRLRGLMMTELGVDASGRDWQSACVALLRHRLAGDPGLAAYVVDAPDRAGLVSCGVGVVNYSLPSPGRLDGRIGYVMSISTDVRHRGRGHGRAVLDALLGWFHEIGVRQVDLHAAARAEPLYRAAGFTQVEHQAFRRLGPAR
jgi:ribosomal protein S18 acetylase RimI-like enzyme